MNTKPLRANNTDRAARFITVVLAAIFLCSCGSDDTEAYVGTWSGEQTMVVSELDMNQTESTLSVVTRSASNPQQVIFTSQGDNTVIKATVSGDTLTYEKQSKTQNQDGVTITMEMEGTAKLADNVLTESGTVKVYAEGKTYQGTWTGTLKKQ